MNKKILVLLTAEYPYGNGETFLENELPFLSKAFDEIHILSASLSKDQTRRVPANTVVSIIDPVQKQIHGNKKALWLILRPIFIAEILNVIKLKIRFSKDVIKVALKSLQNAIFIKKIIDRYIQKLSSGSGLYLYSYWTDDAAIAAMLVKQSHPEIKVFSRMHRWDLYFENNLSSYLPFRLPLLKRSNAVFIISEHGINYLREKFGDHHCRKLVLSRLGTINNLLFKSGGGNKLQLLSCSSMIPRKRIVLIIESLALISDIPIHWDHIGDGEEERSLRDRADELLGNNDNITYCFHGRKRNERIYEFYRSVKVDLFINVSEDEGVPVSIMEAMSFGVPVIATGVGGNPEIVTDNFNGFLLNPDPSAHEIAEAICRFSSLPPGQKEEFRENSYQTWNAKYNADNNYRDFVNIVLSL